MSKALFDIFIDKLQKVSQEIRALEEKAGQCLYEKKDKAGYINCLTLKTGLLVDLPDLFDESANSQFTPTLKAHIKDQLGGMSFSAEKALTLDSIFYMSALLYPENYQEGDKNDLEILVELLISS